MLNYNSMGEIEKLTLDPMTGISYPFVSSLLHTKTGQHSLPIIDPHYGEDGPPTKQDTHRTPFLLFVPHCGEDGPLTKQDTHCTPPSPFSFPLFH